jgi:hypothetical protein
MDDHDATDGRRGSDLARPLSIMAQRMQAEHPDVSTETIAGLLQLALRRTEDARVQTFRNLLAERDVRAELSRGRVPLDLTA